MSDSEYELNKLSCVHTLPGSTPVRMLAVAVLLCLFSSVEMSAQTQATCTFNIFKLSDLQTTVFGVNDYKSVVGEADFTGTPSQKGFIRYSGGSVS